MTHEEKRKDWIRKMDLYKKSGLTMHEWCELNGESYSALRRWKGILSEKRQPGESKWVSVEIPLLPDTSKALKISVNGFVVEVESCFNKELLEDVLKVMKAI